MIGTCSTCKFWQDRKQPIAARDGECRKEKPQAEFYRGDAISIWPVTRPDDWCGEFHRAGRESHG